MVPGLRPRLTRESSHVRVELSNRYADGPVRIGRAMIGVDDRFVEATFHGQSTCVIPAGGSLRVAGTEPRAVIVAFGSSSTAMGWPRYAAELLPDSSRIAIINRGIPGNRIRLNAPVETPSWGPAGLSRFDDDVLGTAGATHLVIAYNGNDWSLPGHVTPIEEMPTLGQLIDSYQHLVGRAEVAGITVALATVTPLGPELRADAPAEELRQGLNEWIRSSDHTCVDFDAAIRSQTDPTRLQPEYAAPDDTHPNINGSKRLAQTMIDTLAQLLP